MASNVSGENSFQQFGLDVYDFTVVGVYFLLVLLTGLLSMCRANRGTVSGYFLAGRYMFWLPVGASVFASNIGSEHFIGLAGSGAASGISVGAFELNALIILQMAGWIFLPVFIASRVCTLPEFMSKRFGGQRIRTYLAVLSLVLYIFTKISVNLYSGAIYINQALQWNIYVSVILLLVMTALCTVTGGLAAVIYTDTLQFFVMISGASIVAFKAFQRVGSWEDLHYKYLEAIPSKLLPNSTCGIPEARSWQLLRSYDDPDMPWPGFLFGQTPASIWYWCTDQMMVQRLLAAKSLSHAQGGALFAGFMKILPLFLIILPGMISRVLFKDSVGCVDPDECYRYCQNRAGCSNIAYPRLVLELMPSGLKGLMMAVMLAALMSDLTSVFNSASTLFTIDIWPRLRKKTTIKELMIVGRVFVLVMVLVSILWIPVIQKMQGGQLYIYIQAVAAYLAPPIAAIYLLAVFWKRTNEKGAFWGLIAGFVVGVIRMVLDFFYPTPLCGDLDDRPSVIRNVHYMYFAIILFWITTLTAIVVSLATKAPDSFRLIRTTYWTRYQMDSREDDYDNLELKNPVSYKQEMKHLELEKEKNQNNENLPEEISDPVKKKDEMPIHTPPRRLCSLLTSFVHWFCGLEQIPKGETEEQKFQDHLAEIATLKQSRKEKWILRCSLCFVVSIGIVLMTFFSVQTIW